MADFFASENGAGLQNGLDVDNAWSFAGVNESLVDADPNNILYLIDNASTKFILVTVSDIGFIIAGNFPLHFSNINVNQLETSCIEIGNRTYNILTPLKIKNFILSGGSTNEINLFNSNYIELSDISLNGDGTTQIGINSLISNNISMDNLNLSNYDTYGIDIHGGAAATNNGFIVNNSITNNCGRGLSIRAANAGSVLTDFVINNHVANDCGEAGIILSATPGGEISNVIIEHSITNNNGDILFGTGIEVNATDNTAIISNIIIRYNTANNTIDADLDGTDGVGIRFDDWIFDSEAYCNTCDGNDIGMSLKHLNNKLYCNLITNSKNSGVWYTINVSGGVSINGFVHNQTIINSGDGYFNLSSNADGGVLTNNIIVDCNNGIVNHSGATFTENNNCLFNNNNENYIDETGNPVNLNNTDIITDPLFIDPTIGNYNLQQNSPCVGTAIKWWGNNPRPDSLSGEPLPDTAIDMGAYQSTWNPKHPLNLQ